MGLREIITGRRRLSGPAEDRLFAMSTAAVTLEALSTVSTGAAAIVLQPLSSADFRQVFADLQEVVGATSADSGASIEHTDDAYGFRWLVVHGADVETLVVAIHGVSDAMTAGGYGDRLLCAVFAFTNADGRRVDWIYSFKRGTFYPFVPRGDADRDTEAELIAKAQIGAELPVEADPQRWLPLWGIPI